MRNQSDGAASGPGSREPRPAVAALRASIPSARHARVLHQLWLKTEGKAWEPPDLRSPLLVQLIEAGWLKRCPMRCGFEAFDTGVTWTGAGRAYFASAIEARRAETIGLGPKDESAVPQADAPEPHP